jgi:amino acid adenylation domain-containing protein
MPDFPDRRSISPIQAALLRASLAGASGKNVEQVEINFAPELAMEHVISAWIGTVEQTAVLQSGFLIRNDGQLESQSLMVENPLQTELELPDSWQKWLAHDRLRPLPLDGGIPWRAVIWPKARKLIWTFHHSLLDGQSIATILRAFQTRLTDAEDPGQLEIIPLPVLDSAEIAEAIAFHQNAFAEIGEAHLEFPADCGEASAHVQRCLGSEVAAQIEAVALRMEVTAPNLLTWAWGQAVAIATGADAVAVGQVRSGPPRPGQAGFSMNTVPLVIRRFSKGPVRPILWDFRKQLLAMRTIENVSPQDLPAGIFQKAGGPWPGGVIMVQRGDLQHQVGKIAGVESIILHERGGESLLASAWIQPELRMEVEASGNDSGTRCATSLLDQWSAIVMALAEQKSENAEDITALPASMQETLTGWGSGGEATAHLHLATAWRDAAASFPTHCALWTPDTSVTYAELAAQVDHLAAHLQDAGVRPGQTVASILHHRLNFALSLLAIARLGAVSLPLDPTLPEKRLLAILEDALPVLILSDTPAAYLDSPLPVLTLDGASGQTCTADLPSDPGATLALLYTSGSTGKPKGVLLANGGVTNEALGIAKLAGMVPGDRLLQFASSGFDTSLEEMLATLLSGSTLVPRPENLAIDLAEFQTFVRSSGITVLDLPTAHWATWCAWMVSENTNIPVNVRATIIGGERASAAAVKDWFASGGRQHLLINTYGPTEASIVATAEWIGEDWDEPGDPAIGRPLPGVFARVCDASGRRMPPGAAGELWLGGICVGSGYWQRPERTAASFHLIDGQRWYRTGDRAFWDDGGKLRFLGRKDQQLKIRGNRVEPNEVIRVLEAFPGIISAYAGPVPSHGVGDLLAAWIRWQTPPAEGWPGRLAKHAAAHLPHAAIPTRWASVEEFKLNDRGKLDRDQLPLPQLTASTHVSSDPPATPTEKRLVGIWSQLLDVETIGRDESFFELGGHSLAALQLFTNISREWKIVIPMATLIQAPSPRLLGEVIDLEYAGHGPAKPARSVVIPVRPDGHLPPLFCIHGGDGGVFFYRDLAEHLPPGRPLLAIESPALSADGAVTAVPVEETAATYVAALRTHQVKGPYYLAGYSYGGLLVYEISRQLIAQGETVAFAGLFDTVNPATTIRKYSALERAGVFWSSHDDHHWFDRIGKLVTRAREGFATHFRVKEEVRAARDAGNTEPHSDLRMLQVREAHGEATEDYQPPPLDLHLTLFKSQATDDKFHIPSDYGWSDLVKSLDIVEVAGKHLTIFSPMHIGALAREISKRL